jgi:hypothetical protein
LSTKYRNPPTFFTPTFAIFLPIFLASLSTWSDDRPSRPDGLERVVEHHDWGSIPTDNRQHLRR